jgi:uncharacterized protein YqjF (DUF2071 family)
MAGREPEERVRRPASAQRWRTITFLHWRYDPDEIRQLVPGDLGLDVDTWDGSAWVSLTPFLMVDFRLGRLPAVPSLSTFPETNLRTYVRGRDGRDGLWFFSLEAASLPLVTAASSLYGEPYRWADMSVEKGETVRYRSRRRAGVPVGHDIEVRPGPPCESVSELDHWLTGRWRAYSVAAGRLATTAVEHEQWPLREATVIRLEQSLLAAAGLSEPAGPPLVHHSPGVDAALGPPRWVSPPRWVRGARWDEPRRATGRSPIRGS